jgi:hypothetical protein
LFRVVLGPAEVTKTFDSRSARKHPKVPRVAPKVSEEQSEEA